MSTAENKSLFGKVLGQLNSAAGELRKRIAELEDRAAALRAEHEALHTAPVPLADFMEYVAADVKRRGERLGEIICQAAAGELSWNHLGKCLDFRHMERTLEPGSSKISLPYLATAPGIPFPVTEEAVFFYFGDIIVERIGEALKSRPWPEAGPPVAQRRKRLAEIEEELTSIEAERGELLRVLEQAGIAA